MREGNKTMAEAEWEDNKTEDNGQEDVQACPHCAQRKTVREEKLRTLLIKRLNCVEGQVRGIKGMVEKDVYCDDILNQIAAVRAALTSISKIVLENHIHGCLVDKIRNGDNDVVDELLTTIGKLL
jgi:DNA-binding FrmR family transcriptional regulator